MVLLLKYYDAMCTSSALSNCVGEYPMLHHLSVRVTHTVHYMPSGKFHSFNNYSIASSTLAPGSTIFILLPTVVQCQNSGSSEI